MLYQFYIPVSLYSQKWKDIWIKLKGYIFSWNVFNSWLFCIIEWNLKEISTYHLEKGVSFGIFFSRNFYVIPRIWAKVLTNLVCSNLYCFSVVVVFCVDKIMSFHNDTEGNIVLSEDMKLWCNCESYLTELITFIRMKHWL